MKKQVVIILAVVLLVLSLLACNKPREDGPTYSDLVTYEGLTYKNIDGRDVVLDILMPTKEIYDKIPVIVYIHGGSFVSGTTGALMKDTRSHTTPKLLDIGYAIISVDYTLCNGVDVFPQNIIDVKDSVRWIRKNADTYGFDTSNIGVWGSSAGGHLASMVAYTNDHDFLGDVSLEAFSSQVDYVININGVTDLLGLTNLSSKAAEKTANLLGSAFVLENLSNKQLALIDSYSPVHYVNEDSVPTIIYHGTADTTVPIGQSDALYSELVENNCEVEYIVIEGARHGLKPITDAELDMVTQTTLDFVADNYN